MNYTNCYALNTHLVQPSFIKTLVQNKNLLSICIVLLIFFAPHVNAAPLLYDEAIDGDIDGNSMPLTVFNLDLGTNIFTGSRSAGSLPKDGDDFRFMVPKDAVITEIKYSYRNVITNGVRYFADTRFLQYFSGESVQSEDQTMMVNNGGSIDPSPNNLFSTILPVGTGTYTSYTLTDGAAIGIMSGHLETWSASWDYTLEITVVNPSTDYVITTETMLTDDTQLAYSPVLGQDAISKLMVYSAADSDGGFNKIFYQRLNTDGSLQGSAMQVSSGLTHDILHDVSGKYIVYSARDHDQTANGRVVVFNLETGIATSLHDSSAAAVGSARVHGDYISWIQSSGSNTWILYYNIAWLGTDAAPVTVAGPSPSPIDLEMGDKYITWSQYVTAGTSTYAQVMAYDINADAYFLVEDDASYDNREPTTVGEWVFYQQQSHDGTFAQIKGVNLGTGEERLVGEHSTYSFQPSFDGEYVGYDALVGDSAEVFVYRMSDGQHFQITSLPGNQLLNNVYGQDIAYVDMAGSVSYLDMAGTSVAIRIIRVAHFEIIPANIRPIANAGADQAVHAGSLVTLDGSASSDPDENYALSYSWSITSSPANSAATLVNADSVSPTFTADQAGNYAIALTVTDSLGLSSTLDSVTVSTSNTAPVADAGTDQSVTASGSVVTLDGSQSYDLESDSLSYAWSLTEKPVGSAAVLSDTGAIMPVFVADVQGTYVAQLIVSDPWASSDISTVTISFDNVKPIANAGSNQSVSVGDTVSLSGSASSDANGDSLTYQWGFVSVPTGSQAAFSNDTADVTNFVADVAGTYILSLVVNDGLINSDPHNINVIATTAQAETVASINQIILSIDGLDPSDFKNKNMANALTKKLISALALIDQGKYQEALDKLNNDILMKTDGCSVTGSPDKNDWIETCTGQSLVYDHIVDAIRLLEVLV